MCKKFEVSYYQSLFHRGVLTQFDKKIKHLRCDNGQEFQYAKF